MQRANLRKCFAALTFRKTTGELQRSARATERVNRRTGYVPTTATLAPRSECKCKVVPIVLWYSWPFLGILTGPGCASGSLALLKVSLGLLFKVREKYARQKTRCLAKPIYRQFPTEYFKPCFLSQLTFFLIKEREKYWCFTRTNLRVIPR